MTCNNQKTANDLIHLNPPLRDSKCESWIPFCKAMLMRLDEISNRKRLFTAEIAINHAISLTFRHFNLPLNKDHFITFDSDDIIRGIILKWNEIILLKWKGVQDRKNLLATLEWKGKKGYLNRATNYLHQFKNRVADALWLRVFQQFMTEIEAISFAKHITDRGLQPLFLSCLTYACLYSLCVAEISFFHSKAKPLIINTALAKNYKIRQYLSSLDAQITILQWENEEQEHATKIDKICARIRRRYKQYLETALFNKFRAFHSLFVAKGSMNDIDFDAFKVDIKFDKHDKAKQFEFDPTPIVSSASFTEAFYCAHTPKSKRKKLRTKKESKQQTNNSNNRVQNRSETLSVESSNCAHKIAQINHNYGGECREFQKVPRFGIERNCSRSNTSITRRMNVEANIQQRRQNINTAPMQVAPKYIYNDAYVGWLQRENAALRNEYWVLMQQLQHTQQLQRSQQTIPNVDNHCFCVAHDNSMKTALNSAWPNNSVSMEPNVSVPSPASITPMDDNMFCDPLWQNGDFMHMNQC